MTVAQDATVSEIASRPAAARGRDEPLFAEVKLERIEERLHELEKGNHDEVIPAHLLNYTDTGRIKVAGKEYELCLHSFRQLAEIIAIPAKTLEKCPLGSGKASRQAIVLHWLSKMEGRSFLVRLKDNEVANDKTGVHGRVRAILPANPSGELPLSNLELFEHMRPYLRAYNMGVQLGNANQDSFHMRTLFREELNIGGQVGNRHSGKDVHSLGVHWTNSETGKFRLSADLIVYRQVCSNGMIAQSERGGLLHRRHQFVDRTTIGADIAAAMEAARARQSELMGGLRTLRDQRIEDPETELRSFLGSQNVSKEQVESVIKAFAEEPLRNRFGILQAMTRAVRKNHPDERVPMEKIAGIYLMKHAGSTDGNI